MCAGWTHPTGIKPVVSVHAFRNSHLAISYEMLVKWEDHSPVGPWGYPMVLRGQTTILHYLCRILERSTIPRLGLRGFARNTRRVCPKWGVDCCKIWPLYAHLFFSSFFLFTLLLFFAIFWDHVFLNEQLEVFLSNESWILRAVSYTHLTLPTKA